MINFRVIPPGRGNIPLRIRAFSRTTHTTDSSQTGPNGLSHILEHQSQRSNALHDHIVRKHVPVRSSQLITTTSMKSNNNKYKENEEYRTNTAFNMWETSDPNKWPYGEQSSERSATTACKLPI